MALEDAGGRVKGNGRGAGGKFRSASGTGPNRKPVEAGLAETLLPRRVKKSFGGVGMLPICRTVPSGMILIMADPFGPGRGVDAVVSPVAAEEEDGPKVPPFRAPNIA